MNTKKQLLDEQSVQSLERRKLIKKAAYVTPALMVLGVITPISKGYAASGPNDGNGGGNGGTCTPGYSWFGGWNNRCNPDNGWWDNGNGGGGNNGGNGGNGGTHG